MGFPGSSLASTQLCLAVCACPGMWSGRPGVSEVPSPNCPAGLSPHMVACGLPAPTQLCRQPWEGRGMSGPALVQSSLPCSTCVSSPDGGSCPADPHPPQPAWCVCTSLWSPCLCSCCSHLPRCLPFPLLEASPILATQFPEVRNCLKCLHFSACLAQGWVRGTQEVGTSAASRSRD